MATVKCPFCAEDIQATAVKCKHCNSWVRPQPVPPSGGDDGPWAPAGWAEGPSPTPISAGLGRFASRRLVRSSQKKMLAGVCGGLGQYLGIDPTLLRILFVFATFFSAVVPGLLIYIILAVVVPADDSPGFGGGR